jgi:hypothetical protein
MTAVDFPFYLFFGIMGIVAGGLIVWLLMAERAFEVGEVRGGPVDEAEAPLLVRALAEDGHTVDEATVHKLLELHDAYFDGRIHDSLAAAENARLEAERVRQAAARIARREAEAKAAAAAAAGPARAPSRRRSKASQD